MNGAIFVGFPTYFVMAAPIDQPGTTCSLFIKGGGGGSTKVELGGGGAVKFNSYIIFYTY